MPALISHKYEVIGQLGRGGMGVVYKVRHTTLETILALKVLPSDLMENPEMVTRFYREARLMARLSHPHIVRVLDSDRDEDLNFYYFIMEYIQGKTLKDYLWTKGPLPLSEVLEISRQVASALAYVHARTPPVVHRDIKPSNIMIEDLSGRAVVMDFGIAKQLGESELTKSKIMLGTLQYCSPEQIRHQPLDGSADIYSLGMVMYEMYTGKQFFAGLDEAAIIGKVLREPRENEPHFTRDTPAEFVKLVTRAVTKSRQQRYQRMEELLRDLEACRFAARSGVADDETVTILLPMEGAGEAPQESKGEALEDLEKQIRDLEEKRQRRLMLAVQTQVREAREKATQAGAEEYASPLFLQGVALEERGHDRLDEQDYLSAQSAYQEAVSLFNRASEEAIIAAVFRKAEQTRQEMLAAKAEAERQGAKERARAFYARGVARQAQADELWGHKTYTEAGQIYAEARGFFEDARALASLEVRREEAEAVRTRAITAKRAAESDETARLAATVFREALEHEQQAGAAMERGEFTQARTCYHAAYEKYEQAQQQARAARQYQLALQAQQQVQAAQQQAEAVGAHHSFPALYRPAAEAQGRGDAWLEARAYEQAVAEYEQAQDGYEKAAREGVAEQARQAAALARRQAEEVCVQAEHAGARERLAEDFAQAQRVLEQGHAQAGAADFAQARSLYEQAAQRFLRLRQEAVLQAARERAEAARQRLADVKKELDSLTRWIGAKGNEAQARAAQAEQAWQAQQYGLAAEDYEQATRLYEEVHREAAEARQRQQALEAKRQAENAQRAAAARAEAEALQRQAASGATLFPERHAEASEFFVEASRACDRADFNIARTGFAHSAALFRQISQEVERQEKPLERPVEAVPEQGSVGRAALLLSSPWRYYLSGGALLTLLVAFYLSGLFPAAAPAPPSSSPAPAAPKVARKEEMVRTPEPISPPAPPAETAGGEPAQAEPAGSAEAAPVLSPSAATAKASAPEAEPAPAPEMNAAAGLKQNWEIRQFSDGRSEAYYVAFSPDGQTVISGSKDKTLKLWDVAAGQKLRTFFGHSDWVNGVAFSPDGRTVISGSDDKTLKLWNVASGRAVRTFAGHADWVNGVAFAPDGKTVVSASKDTTLKLWEVATGREVRTFAGHTSWVFAVAFAPDGKAVVSGSDDKTLKLWDVETGREIRTFAGHKDGVFAVTFAPDGKTVLSGSHDKTLKLWSVATGRELQTFSGHSDWVNSVAFAPDGQTVVSGSKDKTLRLWEVATGREVRTFSGHSATIIGVAFAPDGQTVISGSRDKTLRLWWVAREAQAASDAPAAAQEQPVKTTQALPVRWTFRAPFRAAGEPPDDLTRYQHSWPR